jgi:TolB-like protein
MTFVDLGAQEVKNIHEPIRAYKVGAPSKPGAAAPARVAEAESPPPLPDRPSIAVLAFDNMSGDPEQEYFADGMVEEIITALSRFKWLFVIARNSSFTFKGQAIDVKEIGRRLGVRYVLEGSVRKAAGKVRITGQLIDAVTGAHIGRTCNSITCRPAKGMPRRSGWLIVLWSWTLGSALLLVWQVPATCKTSFLAMLSILNSTARKQFGFFAWH